MRRPLLALVALLLAAPAAARADGLPVLGLDGNDGVVSADGAYRFVTFTSGRNTVVSRLRVADASVARHRTIPGAFTIPAVAYDQSASGLSHDGRTLVLIRPRTTIPQRRTHLLVLDATRFRVQRELVLPGDFSFDAVAPDGARIFLVQYRSLSRHNFDPTNYAVRALDVHSGKLDPAPIVDPREPDEKMGGLPVTRATSSDGRWAYTLYSGSKHPFVHALDTVGNSARCIDLDALQDRNDLFQMRLRLTAGGKALEVVKAGKPVQLVNTRTFAVAPPPRSARRAPAHSATPSRDSGTSPWPYVLGVAALVLLAAASWRPVARVARSR